MKLPSLRLVIPLLLLAGVASVWWWEQRPAFPGLHGPQQATVLPQTGAFTLDMAALPQSGTSALALLVNDRKSDWYGIASGLSSMGIPFHIVTDVESALRHKVVMVYPSLTGANTSAQDLQALASHVRNGGTLLAFSVLGGGLQELFGFETATEAPLHHQVDFADTPFTHAFAGTPVEARVFLGKTTDPGSGVPGVGYQNPRHPALATFEDGTAALTENWFESPNGTGHAYAFGVDWGHYLLLAHGGRAPNAAETYVNEYQPKLDTVLRFIAAAYRQGERDAVLLSPTPAGKDVTVLMTHDIDFTRSIVNAPVYAQVEHDAGVPATYFIQTKYVRDYSDDTFYDPVSVGYLKQLLALGMEVGSHSVAHSRVFNTLPVGSGTEQYPEYRPFVKSFREVEGATVAGELRVSKFLLESQAETGVVSFRPGHLSYPSVLPQLLHATGYRYSSSMTANEALTHLPYRDMIDRAYEAPSPVFEFPVTIEDEEGRLGDRTDAAIAVARRIAAYHGLVNVLVHTDSTDHKLDFTRKFIDALKDSAWFGTVRDYGQWWAARDGVTLTVTATDATTRRVHVTTGQPLDGLTLLLPAGWQYRGGLAGSRQQGDRLVLGALTSNADLDLGLASP